MSAALPLPSLNEPIATRSLRVVRTIAELRAACAELRAACSALRSTGSALRSTGSELRSTGSELRSAGSARSGAPATLDATVEATLGLVPTMGALHAGHLSLVRAAQARCDVVAVSIFVNPTQFAPGEDLDRYPRTFDADCELLEREGVDLLFAPTADEMYPAGLDGTTGGTVVDVPGIGDRLDGIARPGHFRGVATVVAKLFLAVRPDVAFFGAKDAAQVAVLRSMTRDLLFGLELAVCPIVRDPDGLAMSSRNRYLAPDDRRRALVLSQTLFAIERLWLGGERDLSRLLTTLRRPLESAEGVSVEYAEVVDPLTLLPLTKVRREMLVAVAAKVGSTRLIDNVTLYDGDLG